MIKAIIADDEKRAIEQLEHLLADLWPELVVCARAPSGAEALRLIKKHKPRIAFMEVRLPEICGMQVARKVAGTCQVVFTTSCDHYAVNAFDCGSLDYLLKPVRRKRLRKAIQRAKQRLSASSTPLTVHELPGKPQALGCSSGNRDYLQWICTRKGRHSKLTAVDEVCFFKADHKYTAVITREDETLINKSIRSLAEELDPMRFWRIHRSTIVRVAQIDTVRRTQTGRRTIRLKDRPETLTVSRPYLHLFKQI